MLYALLRPPDRIIIIKEFQISKISTKINVTNVPGDLCRKNASTSDGLDLIFSEFAEEFGFYNYGLFGQATFAQKLVVSLKTKKKKQYSIKFAV